MAALATEDNRTFSIAVRIVTSRTLAVAMTDFERRSTDFQGGWVNTKFIGFVINFLVAVNTLAMAN